MQILQNLYNYVVLLHEILKEIELDAIKLHTLDGGIYQNFT